MNTEQLLARPPKRCTRCNLIKPRNAFSVRIKGILASSYSECKECAKRLKKDWYWKNAEYAREYTKAHWHANRDRLLARKRERQHANTEQLRKDARAYYYKDIEVSRRRRREQHEKWKVSENIKTKYRHRNYMYGLSGQAYDDMVLQQGGLCAICNKLETRTVKGVVCALSVDHNHATKTVRRLLCTRCNFAVSAVLEDPIIAAALLQYVTDWSGK